MEVNKKQLEEIENSIEHIINKIEEEVMEKGKTLTNEDVLGIKSALISVDMELQSILYN